MVRKSPKNPVPQSEDIVHVLTMLELEADDESTPGRCCASTASSSVCEFEELFEASADLSMATAAVFVHTSTKHVSFSTVEVREYSVTIGDHPCCSSGLPTALDWEFNATESVEIESFEMNKRHRSRDDLVKTWEERKGLYLEDSDDLRRQTRSAQRQRNRGNRHGCQAFFSGPPPVPEEQNTSFSKVAI